MCWVVNFDWAFWSGSLDIIVDNMARDAQQFFTPCSLRSTDDEDRCHLLGRRPPSAQAGPVEVELMRRVPDSGASAREAEQLRRRRGLDDDSAAGPDELGECAACLGRA